MVGCPVPLLALTPPPLPLAARVPAHCCYTRRSAPLTARFSPAYDTTVRYAAVDWVKNMRTLPGSLILKRISSPLIFNMWITTAVCLGDSLVGSMPRLIPLPHTLLGSALGLLLVFRTNAAYDRFWEARKRWGIVTSESRALASLACTFMTAEQALPMISLVAAFPVVFKHYLRGGSAAGQARDARRLSALLADAEFAALTQVENQPQYVLARLRQLAQASSVIGVSEKERETLLRSTGVLGDCVSACERIYNSPIPLAYSRHTSRFLVLYVSTLPLALVSSLGWATVPVMATICWALFGIFEIGNLIEEPFTAVLGSDRRPLLPLTEICRTIRRDVRAIASYGVLADMHGAPTIQRRPEVVHIPEGFKQLRERLSNTTRGRELSEG
ncbi:MAG: hypothetical protein SGPRY_003460 [Prymnesium sp.]